MNKDIEMKLDIKALRELCEQGVPAASNTVRALIDEIEKLRGALELIAGFDVQWAYGLDVNIEKIKTICEQALKGTDNE